MLLSTLNTYSDPLRRAADRLNTACNLGELEGGLLASRSLWQGIERHLARAEARADGHTVRAIFGICPETLRRQAEFVNRVTAADPAVSDESVEALITINRQAAEMLTLARVE